MDRLLQDVRFAVRVLWRDRSFTATAVLTLALCIGGNAAIFAIVNTVLLRPLPVPEPDRLVVIHNSYPGAGAARASNGVPDYYDRLRETDVFEEQALYNTRGATIAIDGQPQRVTGMTARPSLLRMLRAQPLRGRLFTEAEGEPGNDRKVVLTHATWQQLFAGLDSAIGGELRVNGVPYEIIGVLPPGFRFLSSEVRFWTPLSFSPEERSDEARHNNNWSMIARLKPGATLMHAQQQIDALNARNMERFPKFREILTNAGFRTFVKPLEQDLVAGVRDTLLLLWGGVICVLLIGGVNITNLVLVRSTARMRELATRQALGAGTGRLIGQLLTETVLLTMAGGILGAALGAYGLTLLTSLGMDQLPRGEEIRMDATAIIFTLGLAAVVGVLIGLVPVVRLRHMNVSVAVREEGRTGTSGRGVRAIRRVLVASQVAFAFMLLAGAGVLLASFDRVLAIDPGFEPAQVLTARVSPPASRYPEDEHLTAFNDRLLRAVRSTPGVTRAAMASHVPFAGDYNDSVVIAEDYRMAPGESLISPMRISVSPDYFDVQEISIKAGRAFAESDTDRSTGVVIVDERLARKFWSGRDPVGRRMYLPDSAEDVIAPGPKVRWLTVVGVAADVRMAGLTDTSGRFGAYYLPLTQEAQRNAWLIVKAAGEPTALTATLRKELTAIDPELPLFNVRTLEDRLAESLLDRKTPMLLAVLFAVMALLLAAIGIYGVLGYQVAQRRREIAIRMALGSAPRRVFTLVLTEGLLLTVVGLGAGLTGAVAIRRTLEAQLYGIGALDPVVLGGVAATVMTVAAIACGLPARRAAKTDPVRALAE